LIGLEHHVNKKIFPFAVAGLLFASCAFAHAESTKAEHAKAEHGTKIQSGIASVYGHESGSRTASGRHLTLSALTAAHRTLPFGTKVLVTNKRNGRTVTVEIIDRGPFVKGRVIDLTPAAARSLGFSGLTQVSLAVMRPDAGVKTQEARN
jgi:rare lipoprotein A